MLQTTGDGDDHGGDDSQETADDVQCKGPGNVGVKDISGGQFPDEDHVSQETRRSYTGKKKQ